MSTRPPAQQKSSSQASHDQAGSSATAALSGDGVTESSADETTAILRHGKRQHERDNARSPGRKRPRQASRSRSRSTTTELKSWWQQMVTKYGTVELENKGSVARDHLALERTFLAWLRTSLAFASIGIAVGQLFRLNTSFSSRDISSPSKHHQSHNPHRISNLAEDAVDNAPVLRLARLGKPLGVTFLAISIVVLFVGFHRYFESQHWLLHGKFPASRFSIFLVTVIAAGLIIGSLVLILIANPSAATDAMMDL